jgi:hypothetical protein
MNRKRLISILDSYGAEPARWPAAERAEAIETLRRQPDAGDLMARAGTVDEAFARLKLDSEDISPAPDFIAALTRVPLVEPQRKGWIEVPDWLKAWPQLSSLAAAMMVAGFVVGTVMPTNDQPSVEIEMGLALYGTSMNSETGS